MALATKVLPAKKSGRTALVSIGLFSVLVALVLISVGIGQMSLSPMEVLSAVLRGIGIDTGIYPDNQLAEGALWSIRFPRLVMAVLVGAALAVSGLLMQAIFGNPLAEPGVVGVSAGAALGAAVSIVLGLSFFGEWTVALMAFFGGLGTTLLVYAFSRANGKTEVVTLLLTGIAVNAFCGAGLALMTFLGNTQSREQIVFWQLGSLNGSRWVHVLVVLPVIVLAIFLAFWIVKKLDYLSLGEKSARHLGVNVERLRIQAIVLVALLVAVAVAFSGIIAFVGLVVPHLMRMILGPAHLPLLIASTLGGAVLLTVADLVARTAVPFADLPIGMLTSLIGGPFFFWLLYKTRKTSGGWG